MTNAPTKSAIVANESRKYLMIFVNEADFFASFTCCALSAHVDLVQRHDLLDLRDELLLGDPGFADDRDRVELALAVEELLRGRES